MSTLAKRMIGEMTTAGSVPPVLAGAPLLSNPQATAAKRRIPLEKPDTKKRAKAHNRVVDGMIGHLKEDSRDGFVIPDDAKEVTSLEVTADATPGLGLSRPKVPGAKIKNPYSGEEPLILPTASLVAPDVTPEALTLLDPSQLPGADRGSAPGVASPVTSPPASSPVLNTVLGKPPTAPALSTESAMSRLPGIPSTDQFTSTENVAETVVAGITGEAVLRQGQEMPEHKVTAPTQVMSAFSRFVPRGAVNIQE